jgi:transposase
MSNDKKHNRPKYSLEFKQDAARLVLEKGYSQQQAADHFGISQSALGRWVRAERKPSANESTTKKSCLNLSDHDELRLFRPTDWIGNFKSLSPIKWGRRISPMSGRCRVSFMSRS